MYSAPGVDSNEGHYTYKFQTNFASRPNFTQVTFEYTSSICILCNQTCKLPPSLYIALSLIGSVCLNSDVFASEVSLGHVERWVRLQYKYSCIKYTFRICAFEGCAFSNLKILHEPQRKPCLYTSYYGNFHNRISK